MSTAALVWDLKDPIFARIEEQINWYDAKSIKLRKTYKRIKVTEIVAAALIPFLAGSHLPYTTWVTGGLGVLITILEGVLQLNQYQPLSVTYRATCESLKREKFTYIAGAGVYASTATPYALLAERAETIGSQENTKWTSLQQPQKAAQAGEHEK